MNAAEIAARLEKSADKRGFTLDDPPQESDEEAVRRLAALSLLAYEKVREREASKLGFRIGILDRLVEQARGANDLAHESGVFLPVGGAIRAAPCWRWSMSGPSLGHNAGG